MASESGATSPAPAAQAASNGDGEKRSADNVSSAEAIARFMKAEQAPSETTQTADTQSAPAQESEATQTDESTTSAAEPVTTDSPETESTSPEQTPEETTETPAEEGEADDVLSPTSQTLDEKTREKIQRKINRELGKRKAAEGQVELLRKQLSDLQAQQQQAQSEPQQTAALPSANAPLPEVKNVAGLVQLRQQAKEAIRFVDRAIASGKADEGVDVNGSTLSKDQLLEIKWNAEDTLNEKIPAQQDWFKAQETLATQREQYAKRAETDFPFMADRASDGYRKAQEFKRSVPWLNSVPGGDWILGAVVEKMQTMERAEKAKKEAKPAEAAKPAVKPTLPKPKPPGDQTAVSTTGSTQRVTPDAMQRNAAQADFEKIRQTNVTSEGARAFLERMDRIRRGGN